MGGDTLVKAMGHDFGSDMVCPCGIDWESQRAKPHQCLYVETEAKRPKRIRNRPKKPRTRTKSDNKLSLDRVALEIPMEELAIALGVSRATAGRACLGDVGGKGLASPLLVPRVRAFLDSRKPK